MKTIVIPAQITTVEDRITGNLNLTQLILLATPLFITALVFFLLPPIGHFALYKIVVAIIVTSLSSVMAIRIEDKIVLDRIKLKAAYRLRPRIYTYSKISEVETYDNLFSKQYSPKHHTSKRSSKASLSPRARLHGEQMLASSKYNVTFHSHYGGLSVKVTSFKV